MQGVCGPDELEGLLLDLEYRQASGALLIEGPGAQAHVEFAGGRISWARSERRRVIGQVLVGAGKLHPADLSFALNRSRELAAKGRPAKLGQVLVAEGFVSAADVCEAVVSQLEDALCHVLRLQELAYSFEETELGADEDYCIETVVDVRDVLARARRLAKDWDRVRLSIPSNAMVFSANRDVQVVDAQHQRVLVHVDGVRSVDELRGVTQLEDLTLLEILCDLQAMHAIGSASTPAGKSGSRSVVAWLFIVVVVVGVSVAAIALVGAPAGRAQVRAWLQSIVSGGEPVAVVGREGSEAEALRKRAARSREDGDNLAAFGSLLQLMETFPDSAAASLVALPIEVTTVPAGKEVWINGVLRGRSNGVFDYVATVERLRVEIKQDGRVLALREELDPLEFHSLELDLHRRPRWHYATRGAVRCQPLVSKSVVYLASLDGSIYGLLLDDGAPVLQWDIGGAQDAVGEWVGGIAEVGEHIAWTTLDGAVAVLDPKLRRRVSLRQVASHALLAEPIGVGSGESIAVAGAAGAVYGVPLIEGRGEVERFGVSAGEVFGPLVERNGWVVAACTDRRVVGINWHKKQVAWHATNAHVLTAGPLIVEDAVVVGTSAGGLLTYGLTTGRLQIDSQPCSERVVGVAASEPPLKVLVVASESGELLALPRDGGQPVWFNRLDGIPARPVVSGGLVLVGTTSGLFYALDIDNGSEVWRAMVESPIRAPAVASEGRVVVGAEDGRVWCFDLH